MPGVANEEATQDTPHGASPEGTPPHENRQIQTGVSERPHPIVVAMMLDLNRLRGIAFQTQIVGRPIVESLVVE
jgi:hypothetical protein